MPKSKGERLIILHIGSRNGFVPDGELVFRSKKNSADYHDEMNGDHFGEWMQEILPKLEPGGVIVMDNAPYHSVLEQKIPNRSWRKSDIQNQLFFDEGYTVRELLEVVEKNKPPKTYVIDQMIEMAGLSVLRLPPYHCELNPIEMVWSQVKREVASKNTTFKLADVEVLVKQSFKNVSSQQWSNYENHVIKIEAAMRNIENIQVRL